MKIIDTDGNEVVVAVPGVQKHIDRLEAINAELLIALRFVMPWAIIGVDGHTNEGIGKLALAYGFAAIEKVEGEA